MSVVGPFKKIEFFGICGVRMNRSLLKHLKQFIAFHLKNWLYVWFFFLILFHFNIIEAGCYARFCMYQLVMKTAISTWSKFFGISILLKSVS